MRPERALPGYALAACLGSCTIFLGRLFPVPALLRDAVAGGYAAGVSLDFGWGYLATAPFSALADLLTFNTPRQHAVWSAYLLLAGPAMLRLALGSKRPVSPLKLYGAYLLLLAGFLAWGALCPRPSARLSAGDPDILVLDFHSHTSRSHDGRRLPPAFSPARNNRWHERQGFHAGFVTDHNRADALQEALAAAEGGGYRPLGGEELSLHDSHILALGNVSRIDPAAYSDGLGGLKRFLRESETREGALSVLSLPEYSLHHWGRLEELFEAGADGVELENSSPKGLAFPSERKLRVLKLAEKHGVFVCGVSDSHGWGSATYAWSLLRIPGHARMSPAELKIAVMDKLASGGFSAVSVVTRLKNEEAGGGLLLADPFLASWLILRSFTPAQSASALSWLFLFCGLWRYCIFRKFDASCR